MLKKLYQFLDFFLPHQLNDLVHVTLLYQARLVVAANLCGIFIVTSLFVGAAYLGMSVFVKIGILISCIAFVALIIFLKTRLENFERSLNIGSITQIIILFFTVYSTAFSPQGMGYFGLVWLIPVFLMNAFYFKPKFSIIFFAFNLLFFAAVMANYYPSFNLPLTNVPNFREIFIFFISLVIIFCFFQALLFVQLSVHLQLEITKQQNLLIESAKFQSLGQMASNLAHDINNPLFTIQGKLHQMRNLLYRDQLDLASCDRIIETIESTILRLSQIVKGISTFARQGKGDQMVSVKVQDLIEGNLIIADDRIKQSNINLVLDISHNSNVICYPSFISQVLLNLLNNAIDALETSPVKRIEVAAFTNQEWVEIHIRDSGPGIPKEIEKKIFEPFFTTKKFGKGTGLGLAISKGLIDSHDGELLLTKENNMTTFIVRLPSYE